MTTMQGHIKTHKCLILPAQLLHNPQCDARGGLNIPQVTQYFSFTCWPLTKTVLYLAGTPI